jgi:hypothetical protein
MRAQVNNDDSVKSLGKENEADEGMLRGRKKMFGHGT